MLHFSINGIFVTAEQGSSILSAARAAGIHIPALCDHPALEPLGACRVCLVEIEGRPKLAAACATPVEENISVLTASPRVLETRKTIVELLISNHPNTCTTCTANGKCELPSLCQELGIKQPVYAADPNRKFPLDDGNPFIVRDREKCILCGRCVRVCERYAGYSAVDFMGRSGNAIVDTAPDGTLEDSDCVFCGQCVQVCPVGALAERTARGHDVLWKTKDVGTVCSYCGVGCKLTLRVHPEENRILNVESDYLSETSFNKGRTCVKGRFAWGFVGSGDRLTKPLIREEGVFREASWNEAIKRISAKLSGIKERHGADAIGFFSSARCTNEENYLMQKLARAVVGTNNVDHCAHL